MAERANVTAVDAIEAFRSHLVIYLTKVRPAVEEVGTDVQRMQSWLDNDQRTHWEAEARRRARALEQTRAALFSANISKLRDGETSAEQLAVQRAKAAFEEAEAKLRLLKHWRRDFEGQVQPLVKQVEKLQTIFANDLPKAIASLTETLRMLDAYAEATHPRDADSGSSPPSAAGAAASSPQS
jgi:small-conductance mechanosensitive channel